MSAQGPKEAGQNTWGNLNSFCSKYLEDKRRIFRYILPVNPKRNPAITMLFSITHWSLVWNFRRPHQKIDQPSKPTPANKILLWESLETENYQKFQGNFEHEKDQRKQKNVMFGETDNLEDRKGLQRYLTVMQRFQEIVHHKSTAQ